MENLDKSWELRCNYLETFTFSLLIKSSKIGKKVRLSLWTIWFVWNTLTFEKVGILEFLKHYHPIIPLECKNMHLAPLKTKIICGKGETRSPSPGFFIYKKKKIEKGDPTMYDLVGERDNRSLQFSLSLFSTQYHLAYFIGYSNFIYVVERIELKGKT